METKSPPPCPTTVTVRRNPHRRARAANTPASSNLPLPQPNHSKISSFPIDEILSIEIPKDPVLEPPPSSPSPPPPPPIASSENLKVFLRIRPLMIQPSKKSKAEAFETKNAWPKNPRAKNTNTSKAKDSVKKNSQQVCITVNDANSITLSLPQVSQDTKRIKSEVYEGFEHVFSSESSQNEVYDKMVKPLVEDFLSGKSRMLAALGPSGSGKTHTVFGSVREPGMVPLALRRIFSTGESKKDDLSRIFYLSMFEISSEKGKSEKTYDLLEEGGDLWMQQSTIKGLKEVVFHDAQQAEALIETGILRRATATTNSNSQSSRSQCIINMRCEYKVDGNINEQTSSSILTIVDLAGAERERKTGNQGARLLESNFINNTSMVFGLCLRSLLEHQKNPRKPLQKHFQNSMLTRYLIDYLEGKKTMALVLTVRPGQEDYPDTSFLLRQASPFMQIKFSSVEGPDNVNLNKRPLQTLHRLEQLKKRKCTRLEASEINNAKTIVGNPQLRQECSTLPSDVTDRSFEDGNLIEVVVQSEEFFSRKENPVVSPDRPLDEFGMKDREHKVMLGFSRAIWKVLKEYNQKLKVAQNEVCSLKNDLADERRRCSDLENALETMKSGFSCGLEPSEFKAKNFSNRKEYQSVNLQEASLEAASSFVQVSLHAENRHKHDPTVTSTNDQERSPDMFIASHCGSEISEGSRDQNINQQSMNLSQSISDVEDIRVEDIQVKRDASWTSSPSCLLSSLGCEGTAESSNGEETKSLKCEGKGDISSSDQETGVSSVSGPSTHQICKEDMQGEREASWTSDHSSRSPSLGCDRTTETIRSEEVKDLKCKAEGNTSSCDEEIDVSSVSSPSTHQICEDSVCSGDSSNLKSERGDCRYSEDKVTAGDVTKQTKLEGDSSHSSSKLADAGISSSDMPIVVGETNPLSAEKQGISAKEIPEFIVSRSPSPRIKRGNKPFMVEDKLENVACEDSPVPLLTVPPVEDAVCGQECRDDKISDELPPKETSQNVVKPKRRLLPASSLLLKDISSLAVADEVYKPKGGGRGDAKVALEARSKPRSSNAYLLHLLKGKNRNAV